MTEKRHRQQLIRRLIRKQAIATQDDLRAQLRKQGLMVNQATLSRDLAELDIRKSAGRYVQPAALAAENGAAVVDLSPGILSCTTCGPHLVVLRTRPGQAQAVAAFIDDSAEASITGTVAGDDTLFLATRSRRSQTVALRRIESWFGVKA